MNAPPPTTAPAPVTPDSSLSPHSRQLWRSSRGLLGAAVLLLVAAVVIALLRAGENEALHPRSATELGSRAVAELLQERGIDLTVVTTAAEAAELAGPDTTLLVVQPEALTTAHRETLHQATNGSGGRTLLVAPGQEALDVFAPGVTAAELAQTEEREPECTAPDARAAGTADLGGIRYRTPGDSSTACYPAFGLPTLVTVENTDADSQSPPNGAPSEDTVLLGAPDILYNHRLDAHGNAALAMHLLGTREHLVWYMPSAEDAPGAGDERSLTDLLAPGWRWGALQLGFAVGLAALWRSRRLGPVITEDLPVTVRATETTEGRARLYHQSAARGQAANALRAAARRRLAPLASVPARSAHDPTVLLPAVATRGGDGSGPKALQELLFGPAPEDDASLLRLTTQLDALERALTSVPGQPGHHPAAPPPVP